MSGAGRASVRVKALRINLDDEEEVLRCEIKNFTLPKGWEEGFWEFSITYLYLIQ